MRRDETIESIRWAADRIGSTADRRALLCWSPLATGPIGRVGERAVHFDADDNWTRHPEMRDRRGWIRRGYQAACDRADVLTCNSEATGRFLESLGGRPTVIRNGVDPEFWDPARVAGEPAPAALGSIPRPRIGYAGRLAKRIDVALLLELARRRPEWSFVTIGPTLDARRIAPLKRAPNVHFLGDVNYERLPAFVAAFDVAIVPHRVGELENDGDPTKLYEYLALGLPVVTTPIAGVETFRDWIAIADGADAFEAAIDRFLRFADSGDETARAARRAAVDRPEHHWKSKAEAMLESIDAAMRRKSGGA
jgi:glycosyltransferase involved in cell wall biosynthesis